jgi:peptidoglycan/LPS O-acetylase OafA/YrhL
MHRNAGMDSATSLYLDLVRFTAAFTVFLSHYGAAFLSGGFLWQINPYGDEAVDVFFVLSGYVIGYATFTRERSAALYSASRTARIYSVAFPAVLATLALDAAGSALNPDIYATLAHVQALYTPGHPARQALGALTFTNQLWGLKVDLGSNGPYWSLGYEVWYYVIFGVAFFAPARWRIAGTMAAMIVAGPRIIVLFPLWLAGLGSWWLRAHGWPRSARRQHLLLVLPVALWMGYEVWAGSHGREYAGVPAILDRPQLAQDYIVGLLFAAHLLGTSAVAPWLAWLPQAAAALIRRLAGMTFTLYLLHFPLLMFIRAVLPGTAASWGVRLPLLILPPLLCFAVAQVTERQKDIWRRGFARLLTLCTRESAKAPATF